jgi:two-component system CheB/CheR fusion protein
MAREGLRPSLQAVLNRAKKENIVVRTDNAQLKQNGKPQKVSIEVIPLKNLKERSYLVVFDDVRKAVTSPSTHERSRGKIRRSSRAEGRHVADVERELSETRDFLQSVQEQNESVNEELQASNEEVQSANEELQSINEELETAKEELESTNEELTTVNEELANRNFELNRLNSDLVNLQTSTHLAIVLVGRDLSIRRFSIRAKQAFNLLASDIGRSFNDVRHNLDLPDLETFVGNVISSVREAEREVRDKNGHWYSLRVRPYLTLDNKVDGAVLVVIDIDLLKRTQLAITEASEQIEAIVRTVPDPLVVLEPDLTIRSANEAFYHTFGLAPPDTEGRSIFELDEASWNIPSLRRLLEDIIPHSSFFNAYEITHEFKRIGRCTMLLNARMLLQTDGKPKLILLGIRDITERKEAEERHNLLTDELAHRSKNLLAVIQSIASRSLSGTRSLDDARDVFIQRIQALSRGQSALLSEGIEGASLVRTIQLELEAFSEQIESSGPDLVLHSRVAQSFSLLIHELATNASKHGALSRPEGKIVVRWSVEGGGADARFKFQWHERNGPPVQPPSHRGFGHVLLELAATDFDASPMIDFSPGGFRYEIDAPLSAIVKQSSRKQDS